jgi:hypothetical protein
LLHYHDVFDRCNRDATSQMPKLADVGIRAPRKMLRFMKLPMNLNLVGTSRCDVPAREAAGGTVAPLDAARTAQRAILTVLIGARFGGEVVNNLLLARLN